MQLESSQKVDPLTYKDACHAQMQLNGSRCARRELQTFKWMEVYKEVNWPCDPQSCRQQMGISYQMWP